MGTDSTHSSSPHFLPLALLLELAPSCGYLSLTFPLGYSPSLLLSLSTEVETVEVVLGIQRLFRPRVVIAFPPPDFVFRKGVGPFWKINIEEDEEELRVRMPSVRARTHKHTNARARG